ncbi:recombinational DNA repair protein [Streptococcus phage Javan252]|nr:recombinational DNA repair protein [Streptococcus phage Javan252]
MKVVKQLPEVKDIFAEVIYEGDDFKIKNENGRKVFVSHETDWMNADNPIVGAYCIIEKADGEKILTVMTKKEIDKSWAQAKTKNVQNNFPQEMAKRTVINRAAKQFFNTSDDNDLFIDAVNRTTENEYDNERTVKDITPNEQPNDIAGLMGPVEDEATIPKAEMAEPTEVEAIPDSIPEHDLETGEIVEEAEEIPLFEQLGDIL